MKPNFNSQSITGIKKSVKTVGYSTSRLLPTGQLEASNGPRRWGGELTPFVCWRICEKHIFRIWVNPLLINTTTQAAHNDVNLIIGYGSASYRSTAACRFLLLSGFQPIGPKTTFHIPEQYRFSHVTLVPFKCYSRGVSLFHKLFMTRRITRILHGLCVFLAKWLSSSAPTDIRH